MLLEMRTCAGHGDAIVLDGVSLSIEEHGSLAVLAATASAKHAILTILGFTRLHCGQILARRGHLPLPHRRVQLGIGWVAQEREIFPSLTVEENLLVAARPGAWTGKEFINYFEDWKSGRATWAFSSGASSRCSPSPGR
jgi:branched-chain amino acid transport system ATP-binding protein